MPAKPSIWEYFPQPERDCIPPRARQDRQVWPGYCIYHNRDDSISFGTKQRDYFGWLPAEITRAVPEAVINTIASMVCHAHRMGRKEAYNYLKQFVLEQMRAPDWPLSDERPAENDSSAAATQVGQITIAPSIWPSPKELFEFCSSATNSITLGARPMKKTVQKFVGYPVRDALKSAARSCGVLTVSTLNDRLIIQ